MTNASYPGTSRFDLVLIERNYDKPLISRNFQGNPPAFPAKAEKIAGLSRDFRRVAYVSHKSVIAMK